MDLKDLEKIASELKKYCDKNGKEIDKNTEEIAKSFLTLGEGYAELALNSDLGSRQQVVYFINSYALHIASKIRLKKINQLPMISIAMNLLQKKITKTIASSVGIQTDLLSGFGLGWTRAVQSVKQSLNEKRELYLRKIKEIFKVDKDTEFKMNVQSLMESTVLEYKRMMSDISKECFNYLQSLSPNQPQFSFCHVALGSLARGDITLFSDFESMILLPDNCDKEKYTTYFRWYALLFECFLVSLEETPLRNFCIPGLNSFEEETKDWFWDSMVSPGMRSDSSMPFASKKPLGRDGTRNKPYSMELIRSVTDMIDLLKSGEALKNGYHLDQVLICSSVVCGDKQLHGDFTSRCPQYQEHFKVTGTRTINGASASNVRRLRWKINLKTDFHRTITLFINNLAACLDVEYQTINIPHVQVLETLHEQNFLSDTGFDNLKLVYYTSYLFRSKQYSSTGQEDCYNMAINYLLGRHVYFDLDGKRAFDFFSILDGMDKISGQLSEMTSYKDKKKLIKETDFYSTDVFMVFEVMDRFDYLGPNMHFEGKILRDTNNEDMFKKCFLKVCQFVCVKVTYELINFMERKLKKEDIDYLVNSVINSTSLAELISQLIGVPFQIPSGISLSMFGQIKDLIKDMSYLLLLLAKSFKDFDRAAFKKHGDAIIQNVKLLPVSNNQDCFEKVIDYYGKIASSWERMDEANSRKLRSLLYDSVCNLPLFTDDISDNMAQQIFKISETFINRLLDRFGSEANVTNLLDNDGLVNFQHLF